MHGIYILSGNFNTQRLVQPLDVDASEHRSFLLMNCLINMEIFKPCKCTAYPQKNHGDYDNSDHFMALKLT